RLAAWLAGVETPGADDESATLPGAQYVPAPPELCGQAGAANAIQWAGTRAYRVRDIHIGVRHNSEYAGSVLDALLPGLRVDDPRAPANYAVALYAPGGRGVRELNLL